MTEHPLSLIKIFHYLVILLINSFLLSLTYFRILPFSISMFFSNISCTQIILCTMCYKKAQTHKHNYIYNAHNMEGTQYTQNKCKNEINYSDNLAQLNILLPIQGIIFFNLSLKLSCNRKIFGGKTGFYLTLLNFSPLFILSSLEIQFKVKLNK